MGIQKCINISWEMCIQYPLLTFTPNKFNVEQLNKIKYHQDLHNVYNSNNNNNDYQFILYYIWPIISHNNFHSIVDYMKVQVCLGDTLPNKTKNNDNEMKNNDVNPNENEEDEDQNDEDDSVGMLIFDHDDNYNNNHIGDDDSYYDHHITDQYE